MELLPNNSAISVGSIPELRSGAHLSADFTPHPHWREICPHKRRFLQNEFWVVAKSAGELTDDHLPSRDAP
jgi:hypothetical protein